jgi:hypothetical protein
VLGARMVCATADVASTENIFGLIKQTEGVGKELYSHILEFLSSGSIFIFPKQQSTESMSAIASAVAAGLTEDEKKVLVGKRKNSTFENDSDFEAGPSNPNKSVQIKDFPQPPTLNWDGQENSQASVKLVEKYLKENPKYPHKKRIETNLKNQIIPKLCKGNFQLRPSKNLFYSVFTAKVAPYTYGEDGWLRYKSAYIIATKNLKMTSEQAGGDMKNKSTLSLKDGIFSIDGVAQKVKIDQETSDILSNIDWSKTDLLNHDNHCYPFYGTVYIHQIIAAHLKDENTEHWKKLGWTIENGGKLIIGHLDDNCYNFNKSNLMWIPERLNSWSRKDIVYAPTGGKAFRTKLKVGKFINTDSYADKEMVLHEKNILKMLAVQDWARDYMLKYGLLIPPKFASSYTDVSTLLACATVKQKAKVSNKVKKQLTKTSVEMVTYDDLTQEEKEFHDHEFEVSGVALNDDERIVRYTGATKSGIFWMAVDDFERIFEDFNGEFGLRKDGYIQYRGQMLHLIVMGRSKGEGDHDGQVGRHYNDVKIDNRKRTLLMGSHSENQMDKKDGSLPMGVSLRQAGNYQVRIDFYLNLTEHFTVGLGTFSDVDTASKAFQSVYKMKAKITAELEKMDQNDRKAMIKHVKSYISLI